MQFVNDWYPKEKKLKWDVPEDWIPEQEEKAELLYKNARNPLVHALGIELDGSRYKVRILKRPLSPQEISQVEQGEVPSMPIKRNGNTWGKVSTVIKSDTLCQISVPTLYWGIYRSLEELFRKQQKMENVERAFKKLRMI